jgi:hypothetical protein
MKAFTEEPFLASISVMTGKRLSNLALLAVTNA